jgi:hypothetical protein
MVPQMMEEYGSRLPELQKALLKKYRSAPAFILTDVPAAANALTQAAAEAPKVDIRTRRPTDMQKNRQLLEAFYKTEDTKKVKMVPQMMEEYGSRLPELQKALLKKYGAAPAFDLGDADDEPDEVEHDQDFITEGGSDEQEEGQEEQQEEQQEVLLSDWEQDAAQGWQEEEGGRDQYEGGQRRGGSSYSNEEWSEEGSYNEESDDGSDAEYNLAKVDRSISKVKAATKMIHRKLQRGFDDFEEEESCRHRLMKKRKALERLQRKRDRLEEQGMDEELEDEDDYGYERHRHPHHHRPSQAHHRPSQAHQHRPSQAHQHRPSQAHQHRPSSGHERHEHHEHHAGQEQRFSRASSKFGAPTQLEEHRRQTTSTTERKESKFDGIPTNRKLVI